MLAPTELKAGLVPSWEDPSQGCFLSWAPGLSRRGKARSALRKSPTTTVLDLALPESLWLTPPTPTPAASGDPGSWLAPPQCPLPTSLSLLGLPLAWRWSGVSLSSMSKCPSF